MIVSVIALSTGITGSGAAGAVTPSDSSAERSELRTRVSAPDHRVQKLRGAVADRRSATWRHQDALSERRYPTEYAERKTRSAPYLVWLKKRWAKRAHSRYRFHVAVSTDAVAAIRYVFGSYAGQALAVARCESGLSRHATNGQYLGLFQMGSYARSRYGHGDTFLEQARAAYGYFVDSGRDWSPWQCRPWGLGW